MDFLKDLFRKEISNDQDM